MQVPPILMPLTSGATARRGVFLIVGGIVLAAYLLLGTGFAQMYAEGTVPPLAVTVLLVVTAAIAFAPPFLLSVQSLEVVTARALLDADLPAAGGGAPSRARGALWYLVHLLAGGAVTFVLLSAVPIGVILLMWQFGEVALLRAALGTLADWPALPAVLTVVVLLVLPAYVIAGLGELLRRLAPALLGPSAAERIAQLEADKRRLAARNHLARDLHDTVGHALTVTTLQASAATRPWSVTRSSCEPP